MGTCISGNMRRRRPTSCDRAQLRHRPPLCKPSRHRCHIPTYARSLLASFPLRSARSLLASFPLTPAPSSLHSRLRPLVLLASFPLTPVPARHGRFEAALSLPHRCERRHITLLHTALQASSSPPAPAASEPSDTLRPAGVAAAVPPLYQPRKPALPEDAPQPLGTRKYSHFLSRSCSHHSILGGPAALFVP